MHRVLAFALCLCAVLPACGRNLRRAGDAAVQTAPTPCSQALAFVINHVEANYPGFRDKVTEETRGTYAAHTSLAEKLAGAVEGDDACHPVLSNWVTFFHDKHIAVIDRERPLSRAVAEPSPETLRARFAGTPSMAVTEESARQWWATGVPPDPIVGIYQQWNGAYRLAVVPDTGGSFAAVVLRADSSWWVPGQVKARFRPRAEGDYEARFHLRDHQEQRTTARLVQNLLKVVLPGGESWFLRVEPVTRDDLSLQEFPRTLTWPTRFERLNSETVVLHIPDFSASQRVVLDSLLALHRDDITQSRNLIIDIRSNPGGSDYVFAPLLPFLYTDPILQVPHEVLATPANIRKFENLLAGPPLPEAEEQALRLLIAKMSVAPPGTLVRRGSWELLALDSVLPRPARVALVVDRGCGSSCEQFVLAARQSRKVVVYGENTAGVVDYGNVNEIAITGGRFLLAYPTSRSGRLPGSRIDPMGIVPDVPIPDGQLYWVRWVQRVMERR